MKSIKNTVIALFILVMIFGNINLSRGQGSLIFSETYTFEEITSQLNTEDAFFSLVDTRLSEPSGSILGTCSDSDASRIWEYVHCDLFLKQLPSDVRFAWGPNTDEYDNTLFVLRMNADSVPGPDQMDIDEIHLQKDDTRGSSDILITFNKSGAEKWATLTGKNVGRNVAILIDGKVYAAPKVMMAITKGKCRISGDFSEREAVRLKELME